MAIDPMAMAQLLQGKMTKDGSGPGSLSALTSGLGGMAEDMTKQMSPVIYMLAGAGLKEIPRLINAFMDLKSSNQPGDLQEEPEQDPAAAGGQPSGAPPAGGPPGMPPGQPGMPGANPMAAIMAMMAARQAAQQGGAPGGMPPAMGSGSPAGAMGPLAALMAARQRMGA